MRISESKPNDYLGRPTGEVRVSVFARTPDEVVAIRNEMMAYERLSGRTVRIVMKRGRYKCWHETYSDAAGSYSGRATGRMVAQYIVEAA